MSFMPLTLALFPEGMIPGLGVAMTVLHYFFPNLISYFRRVCMGRFWCRHWCFTPFLLPCFSCCLPSGASGNGSVAAALSGTNGGPEEEFPPGRFVFGRVAKGGRLNQLTPA